MTDNENAIPALRRTPQRHTLLQQFHTLTGNDQRWVRARNPRKKEPASGLPDYLYTFDGSDERPSSVLQRAVRELDNHGFITAASTGAMWEPLTLSKLGEQTLTAWNEPNTSATS